ncbi:hypothetical protein [Gloeocapsopsis dulcis]|uniref:Uncharacterized protein n=1 Tax=Gloeocapsopsis dulcis AAB1 = 1H9 TaxID=1433147 RepID=A0A6N8G051_9CHRO|nr:hypothetical protein [Gloeocapsopsis dulcis]MUL38489.1 hypothetical protein [Gloeocapsopsis dulcis AAB1 = 1H9]WNN88848.1 hypothetical protein P0S91_21690 [Gloeocapsopsis dulcis]
MDDDNQSTQQSSQQRSDLQLARARRRGSAKSTALNSLFALLLSPWLLWPLLWLILLLATTLSIFSLTFTGFVDRVETPVPLVVQTPDTATSGSNRIAIWVVGAIVVCAVGYGIVFRQLQGSSQPKRQRRQRTRKRLPRKVRPRVKSTGVEPTISVPTPEPPVKVTESVEPPIAKIREPQIPEPPITDVKETIPVSDGNGSGEDPKVTILPPEEIQSVNVTRVLLAEMMDIRKHRSLSSILGKTYDDEVPSD